MNLLWVSFLGSWIYPLLNQLNLLGNIRIGIIIPVSNGSRCETKIENGIITYILPFKNKELCNEMTPTIFEKYKQIIDDFKPDIIHVHGTEKNLAQIQNYITDIPVAISIQGIMVGYRQYYNNYLLQSDYKKHSSFKNLLGYGGVKLMHKNFVKAEKYEKDILENGKYFIGRTEWDKAHILFRNKNAEYCVGEELLRDNFYKKAGLWSVDKCKRHTIFTTSGFNPIKGLYISIQVIQLLKQFYPDIWLRIPGLDSSTLDQSIIKRVISGEEYISLVIDIIKKHNLEENIVFLGRLDGEEMANELIDANVFLSPTSIDNSPNSVGEATMIGTPIVVTPVGGVPSIFTDNKDVLFAPAGDPYTIALQIKKIFDDDELANRLSDNAKKTAQNRHNVESTSAQYVDIYNDIISKHKTSSHR